MRRSARRYHPGDELWTKYKSLALGDDLGEDSVKDGNNNGGGGGGGGGDEVLGSDNNAGNGGNGSIVDVDELAAWAAGLAPCPIHDFKPMVLLPQGLLQLVIKGRLRFYSADIMAGPDPSLFFSLTSASQSV